MLIEVDEALMAEAKASVPSGYLIITLKSYDVDSWNATSPVKNSLEGTGTTINEALQSLLNVGYAKKTDAELHLFCTCNPTRGKFEALNKFMENYPNVD